MRRSRQMCALLAAALALVATATPSTAAHWKDMGSSDTSLDKLYVDLDSIKISDGLRLVTMMQIYPEARTNVHGFLMDRHMQISAVDCEHKRSIGVMTIGYLKEKRVGSSPQTPDWRHSLKPIPASPFVLQMFDLICTSPPTDGDTFTIAVSKLPPTAAPAAAAIPGATTPIPAPPNPAASSPPSASPTPPAPEIGGPGWAPSGQPMKVGTGSGIMLDNEGYVLTNVHVVNGCKAIAVKPHGSQMYPASMEATDPKNDLAILKGPSGHGSPAEFRKESMPPRLGEGVGVVGYPLAGILSTEPKATFGQVNSVAGMNNDYTVLQISAPVQPGNSGGPVLDEAGSVIGVVVSTASPALAAKIGVAPQNVNFAIRGEMAQIFMNAHGVPFSVTSSRRRLQTDEIAAAGENSAVQVVCVKP